MKKINKKYIVISSLLLVCIAAIVLIIFFPNLFKRKVTPKTYNVFGAPREQVQRNFPTNKPAYTAIIGKINPASVQQQSLTVYKLGDTKKTPVFERSFYADGFRGNGLIYTLASNSAEIIQTGFLGTIGCNTADCLLPWSNYYKWDSKQNTFILDNATHTSEFKKRLTEYQTVDKKGCSIVGNTILPNQGGLSFTQLYKKYPTAQYYCSAKQGILPANLLLFLQTEKTLQKIVSGENLGSNDIRDILL